MLITVLKIVIITTGIGTYKGKKATPGVYVYLVEFTWSDDEEDFVAGDVTLVR
ncbi:MAG: hypothetical protein R2771_15860 [Saprospiraceae bacterium]